MLHMQIFCSDFLFLLTVKINFPVKFKLWNEFHYLIQMDNNGFKDKQ